MVYSRPSGAYAGTTGSNKTKYQDDASATPKRAISSSKVDGDINYLIDAVNELETSVAAIPTLSDGDKGDITVSSSGAMWTIDNDAVTLAKIATLTANRLVGTDGSGNPTEVTVSGATLSGGTLTVSAGAPISNGGYASGHYTFGMWTVYQGMSEVVTANRLYAVPFMVNSTTTFDRIGIDVSASHASNARLGIYNMAGGVPTSLVLDAGTVSVSTTGNKEVTISQSLSAGMYALGVVFSGTPTMTSTEGDDGTYGVSIVAFFNAIRGTSTVSGSNVGWYVAHTYGALPSTFGTPTVTSRVPTMFMRAV